MFSIMKLFDDCFLFSACTGGQVSADGIATCACPTGSMLINGACLCDVEGQVLTDAGCKGNSMIIYIIKHIVCLSVLALLPWPYLWTNFKTKGIYGLPIPKGWLEKCEIFKLTLNFKLHFTEHERIFFTSITSHYLKSVLT